MNTIYAIQVCTFSCDIYGEDYIHSYWTTREKAEDCILRLGLLDKYNNTESGQSVNVITIKLDIE